MRITDVCDHCLDKIFAFLDLQSLFNVAVANESLRPAARAVYKKKTKKYLHVLHIMERVRFDRPANHISINSFNILNVYGLKTCLQFVRCFGPSLHELTLSLSGTHLLQNKFLFRQCNKYLGHKDGTVRINLSVDRTHNVQLSQMFPKNFLNLFSNVVHFDAEDRATNFSDENLFPNLLEFNLHVDFRYVEFRNANRFLVRHAKVVDVTINIDYVPLNMNGADALNDCLDILPRSMKQLTINSSTFLLPLSEEEIQLFLQRIANEQSLLTELSLIHTVPLSIEQAEFLLTTLS